MVCERDLVRDRDLAPFDSIHKLRFSGIKCTNVVFVFGWASSPESRTPLGNYDAPPDILVDLGRIPLPLNSFQTDCYNDHLATLLLLLLLSSV